MKNYISVFTLFTKRSFGKIIALFLIIAAAEIGLFIHNLYSEAVLQNEYTNGSGKNYLLGIETILEQNFPLKVVLAIGFILTALILCLMGCEFSGRQGYTLRRLNITEKKVFLCQSIYSASVFGLYIMLQSIVFYFLCIFYIGYADGHENAFDWLISNQTVFLAFYRSDILHALMPMDDILKHISNFIMITALGFSVSSFSYFTRRKNFPIESILLIPVILINFASDWTEMTYEIIIIGMSLFIIGSLITRISMGGQAYEK